MFFDTWPLLGRTLFLGVLFYLVLLIFLRIFGKRSMADWNAFDWIVTVALGSTLASCLLDSKVTLAQGTLAFATLLVLQFIVTWLSVRSKKIAHLVKSQPALLVRDGRLLRDVLKEERVTESEIYAALRGHGLSSVADASAVVLETNGNFSVLEKRDTTEDSTLQDVRGFDRGAPDAQSTR